MNSHTIKSIPQQPLDEYKNIQAVHQWDAYY